MNVVRSVELAGLKAEARSLYIAVKHSRPDVGCGIALLAEISPDYGAKLARFWTVWDRIVALDPNAPSPDLPRAS